MVESAIAGKRATGKSRLWPKNNDYGFIPWRDTEALRSAEASSQQLQGWINVTTAGLIGHNLWGRRLAGDACEFFVRAGRRNIEELLVWVEKQGFILNPDLVRQARELLVGADSVNTS